MNDAPVKWNHERAQRIRRALSILGPTAPQFDRDDMRAAVDHIEQLADDVFDALEGIAPGAVDSERTNREQGRPVDLGYVCRIVADVVRECEEQIENLHASRSVSAGQGAPESSFAAIADALGIEWDDLRHGWWVPAEPGPILVDTIPDAIRTTLELATRSIEKAERAAAGAAPAPSLSPNPVEQRRDAHGVRLVRTGMDDSIVLADIATGIRKHNLTLDEIAAAIAEQKGQVASLSPNPEPSLADFARDLSEQQMPAVLVQDAELPDAAPSGEPGDEPAEGQPCPKCGTPLTNDGYGIVACVACFNRKWGGASRSTGETRPDEATGGRE